MKEDNTAVYMFDHLQEYQLSAGEIIVSFTNTDTFKEVIHLDDGDIKCLQILAEENKPPVVTR
jgi:hypothetical protein